ncbi:MAG: polysaccharide deacetylase family protein [Pseudomonadota bacterium]
MKHKPIAAISLDLDNLWSYQRADGQRDWQNFKTYLPFVIPRIVRILETLEMQMTVFVVGKDAEIEENKESLLSLGKAGHAIGNHSYLHEPWMHKYSDAELGRDLEMSESALHGLFDVKLHGFRAPGFSASPRLLNLLTHLGYTYDASSFPTFIGPLARWAYFRSANLSDAEKAEREDQFGTFSDGFLPLKPHRLNSSAGDIIEVPVTTFPILKTPIHLTYIHYLAERSENVAFAYFKTALFLCRKLRITPVILLHPLDFLAEDKVSELAGFPGFGKDTAKKAAFTENLLDIVNKSFQPTTLCQFVESIT